MTSPNSYITMDLATSSLAPGDNANSIPRPITPPEKTGVVVFSGGSAANSLVDIFRSIVHQKKCQLSYVIPISDNGGSSSELIRVFGGPGIGDIRSRLVRLIPEDDSTSEKASIRHFFNYRLPDDPDAARLEWLNIVEARHELWNAISSSRKELIRPFLNMLNLEIVKRARPSSVFTFSRASIGNMFLTGARLFTGSLESSIELLTLICHVPESTKVLPAVNTNFTHHISAGLADGTIITGQNSISHPSAPTAVPDVLSAESEVVDETEIHDAIEDANLPGTLPSLRKQNISFSKEHEADLPARIERIWYINPYGQEIRLKANPKVLESLQNANCVIYSIGSLYTSLIPNLILRGVGEAILSPSIRSKVLILNSTTDRETGPSSKPFSATDFVAAIAQACWESRGMKGLPPRTEYRQYVTHIFHLEGAGTPVVDKAEMIELGIETNRLYGRAGSGGWMRYDDAALEQAIAAKVGPRVGRSRRNTLKQ
ncbi:UPF0052 domain protein [Microthyrium microscopicum]|uniref:UPF0052 domain protein n=1 Tax=Microthyrium microscopicum TaxID=703497 RepID=A0A6A6U057_9PEZI|nr:UPF0052 domain protein [Microthyrium microscopicum]